METMPRTKVIHIDVPVAIHTKLKMIAAHQNKSMLEISRDAIVEAVEEYEFPGMEKGTQEQTEQTEQTEKENGSRNTDEDEDDEDIEEMTPAVHGG
jgi:hypothetical protein